MKADEQKPKIQDWSLPGLGKVFLYHPISKGREEAAPIPSPSPTPTMTPTPSITPTSSVTPTPTPSATLTPTPTPSATPAAPLQMLVAGQASVQPEFSNGAIETSDYFTTTGSTNLTVDRWNMFAYNDSLGYWAHIDWTNGAYYSSNGTSWSQGYTNPSQRRYYWLYANENTNETYSINISFGYSSELVYTQDGVNWSATTPSAGNKNYWDSIYFPAGDISLISADDQIYSFTGSVLNSWTLRLSDITLQDRGQFTTNFGKVFCYGAPNSGAGKMFSSTDGINWTGQTDNAVFTDRCFSPGASKPGVISLYILEDDSIIYTTDGSNWSRKTGEFSTGANNTDVYWSSQDNKFYAMDSKYNIKESTDGLNWTTLHTLIPGASASLGAGFGIKEATQ